MTQHYVGTKIVFAYPAKQKDSGLDGYNVVYKGAYTSWCPKSSFEEYNIPVGDIGRYPDWLQRLIAEAAILDSNRTKLIDAIQANKVPQTEVQILTEQWECMTHLSVILHSRISRGVDIVLGHVRD